MFGCRLDTNLHQDFEHNRSKSSARASPRLLTVYATGPSRPDVTPATNCLSRGRVSSARQALYTGYCELIAI
jgi:hypothetical protein